MNPPSTHLRIATTATILMGLAIALGAVFPEATGLGALVDALFWPTPAQGDLGGAAQLGLAVSGGILSGFGVAMDRLTRLPDGARRADVAGALLTGLAAWFVVDSGASILVGATFNALGNAAYLALIAPPLVALRRVKPQPNRAAV